MWKKYLWIKNLIFLCFFSYLMAKIGNTVLLANLPAPQPDLSQAPKSGYVERKADRLGGPNDLVLKLTPIKPTAQYAYLLLAVRPTDYMVVESMVVSKHSRNHFIFSKIHTNTKMSKKRFRFRPPPGTRILKLKP